MRIWVDLTAPAHPVVLSPVVRRLEAAGHEVVVTSRDYAQTVELANAAGLRHTVVGRHGGASRVRKLLSLLDRVRRVRRRAAGAQLAIAHGSNELALAARSAGVPAVNLFDYEFAVQQHHIGCRLARRVMTPDAIPPSRLRRFGVDAGKLAQFPGLKEEYYLHDWEPDPGALDGVGADPARIVAVLRPPPDVSLYHRSANRLFPQVLEHLGARDDVHAVVLPRTDRQRREVRELELPSLRVSDAAVDARSLIAAADLVVSAGGTMNREAVALGTPVYTIFGGPLGGVDEALIASGRLRPLTDPRAIEVRKRPPEERRIMRRDPQLLADLALGAVG